MRKYVSSIVRLMRQTTEGPQVFRVNSALAGGNLTATGGMFPRGWSLKTGQTFDRGFPSVNL